MNEYKGITYKNQVVKPWIVDYIQFCCDFLNEDTSNLSIRVCDEPGTHRDWYACLYTMDKGKGRIELSSAVRNTSFWKKIILHECIHYKMRHIDFVSRCEAMTYITNKKIKKHIDSSYLHNLEDFVYYLTDKLYPLVNKD